MNLPELMQSIKDNKIPRFLVFYGQEYEVMKFYTHKIISLGYEAKFCDLALYVANNINKKSLIKKNKVYIVSEDISILKNEKALKKLKEQSNNSNNICILKYNSLDKRSKFYKEHKESIVEFEPLSINILMKHIDKELDSSLQEKLIEICHNSYGRILLELDKIYNYSKSINIDINKSCNKLIKENVIHQDIGDITFQLTDAIMVGNLDNANKYLNLTKLRREPTQMVLSILYDNFKNMLLIQGLGGIRATEENTGLKSNQLWSISRKLGGYSNQELVRALKVITDVEQGIKKGTIDSNIALDYCTLKIMR